MGVVVQRRAWKSIRECEGSFVTDDVASAYKKALAAGAAKVTPPKEKPWGQTVAYVRDLNGFLVELCTAVES